MQTKTKIILASFFFFSCSKGESDSYDETSTNGIQISESLDEGSEDSKSSLTNENDQTTSENPECIPGYEGCKCVGEKDCLNGLTCLSKICVDAGDSNSGTSENETSNGETTKNPEEDNTTGEIQNCEYSFECANNEVCVDYVCGDTDLYFFNVTVLKFQPDTCVEDGIGTAEIYYAYYMSDEYQLTSTISSMCPGEWLDIQLYYDSVQSFAIDFWESDPIDDDFYGRWCFTDENDNCIPVPKEILHEGYIGDDTIEWQFEPISQEGG